MIFIEAEEHDGHAFDCPSEASSTFARTVL